MTEQQHKKDPEEIETPDFNNRGPLKYLQQCHNKDENVYSPTDIALETDFTFWTSQFKLLMRKMEHLETENRELCVEIGTFSNRLLLVEEDNAFIRKTMQEYREQCAGKSSDEALQGEIRDLKSKQEEIKSQQMSLKRETDSHINTWAQVVKGKDKAPPLIAVKEVV